MRFIHDLPLKSKLISLFFLISSGLLLIGVAGYLNITSMKKNLDDLYFGSFIPVNELNLLIKTYHNGIEATVYKVKEGVITPFEASEKLSYSLDSINMVWNTYVGHYKHETELPYVTYAAKTLQRVNRYIERIIDICHRNENIHRLSTNGISKNIETINRVLTKMVTYETDVARQERKTLLISYDSTLLQLLITLGLVICALLLLSFAIFKSIHYNHRALELAAEKLKRANVSLENASNTDPLTGLNNRRYFNLIYDRALKRAKRTGQYITFMMLDVDHFKLYNDTYGHLEGDNALKAVATAMKESLQRPGDHLFRLGGEEFGIIITDTDPVKSQKMAERIRYNVEAMKIIHEKNSTSDYLTVSIGLTTLIPSISLDEDVILSEADVNLYKAKKNGRNQYAVSTNILQHNPLELKEDVA